MYWLLTSEISFKGYQQVHDRLTRRNIYVCVTLWQRAVLIRHVQCPCYEMIIKLIIISVQCPHSHITILYSLLTNPFLLSQYILDWDLKSGNKNDCLPWLNNKTFQLPFYPSWLRTSLFFLLGFSFMKTWHWVWQKWYQHWVKRGKVEGRYTRNKTRKQRLR